MGLRGGLYRAARLLGDVNAVSRGKIGRRAANKVIGRKVVPKLWRT